MASSALAFMSRSVRKRTFGHGRPAKIQMNLCIRGLIGILTRRILDSPECKVSSRGQQISDQTA